MASRSAQTAHRADLDIGMMRIVEYFSFTPDPRGDSTTTWNTSSLADVVSFWRSRTGRCTVRPGSTIDTGTATVIENVVARTAHSYTYAQPFAPVFYHGTLAVEAVDAAHSRLVYSLIWNQNGLPDAAARKAAIDGRKVRFQAAVDKMAAAANAP